MFIVREILFSVSNRTEPNRIVSPGGKMKYSNYLLLFILYEHAGCFPESNREIDYEQFRQLFYLKNL